LRQSSRAVGRPTPLVRPRAATVLRDIDRGAAHERHVRRRSRLTLRVDAVFLIASWTVASARRDELFDALSGLIGDVVAKQPGFVSAELFESSGASSVLVQIQMRTVKDRQHLEELPELRNAIRGLRQIAESHDQRYSLVKSFGQA
jgi:hypothetical protein